MLIFFVSEWAVYAKQNQQKKKKKFFFSRVEDDFASTSFKHNTLWAALCQDLPRVDNVSQQKSGAHSRVATLIQPSFLQQWRFAQTVATQLRQLHYSKQFIKKNKNLNANTCHHLMIPMQPHSPPPRPHRPTDTSGVNITPLEPSHRISLYPPSKG